MVSRSKNRQKNQLKSKISICSKKRIINQVSKIFDKLRKKNN